MGKWIDAEQKPEKADIYFVKYNGGTGQVEYDGEKWLIPDALKSTYKILFWCKGLMPKVVE